ncbi:hypothetical protein ES332_D08G012800v1 [Gossypium tomentosum]|uniref:Dof zinc finger protein n=1 Tax=Gossypium tomentosum TaxID=34277 RepID=A0A5D2JNI6_GOSTO|nr:hypothetical protein ES332_D08G012800v1 [Gossypium tomentosum]
MDPSSRQYQEMPNPTLGNMMVCTKGNEQQERKPRPQPEQALKCPRCDSTNTKFCYYNNYSLSQPRYFCKSCRRYWTKGGTLRNVPVGGGCRKNRRSSSSSSSSTSSKRSQDQLLMPSNTNLPPIDTSELSLAIARLQKQANVHLGFDENELPVLGNPNSFGLLANQNHFQGFYNYGFENSGGETMMLPYNNDEEIISDATIRTASNGMVAAMKREVVSDGNKSDENQNQWGLQWQLNGDHGNNYYNMVDFDSVRENWSGLSSTWHGLLNSPLM